MSNSLDPDQDRKNVGPDLGANGLQRLFAEDKISVYQFLVSAFLSEYYGCHSALVLRLRCLS